MRDHFVEAVSLEAKRDPKVHLITGDLGFGVLTKFEKDYPSQYTNAGVAEQSMTGLAAGLAMAGFKVFTYSIGNFSTLRCLEQIRNDICYHDLNVTIVSVGGGFSYGALGFSHHATEDLSIMRSLPGISVYVPGCIWEAQEITKGLFGRPGPKYLRIDKSGTLSTRKPDEIFAFEKVRMLCHGEDVLIVAAGGILEEALAAESILRRSGIFASVMSIHSLKPFDGNGFLEVAKRFSHIVSLEENVVEGGLGSLLAETLFDSGLSGRKLLRLGIRKELSVVGDQKYLRKQHHLDAESVSAQIREIISLRKDVFKNVSSLEARL